MTDERIACSPIDFPADHIYDTEGCTSSFIEVRVRKSDRAEARVLAGWWNDPGNYDLGFDTCAADTVVSPPGECAFIPSSFFCPFSLGESSPSAEPLQTS